MKKIEPASGEAIAVGIDADRYLHHLAHLNLPIESKRELVRTIGRMMCSFVDRAFGHDSAQLARKDGDGIQVAREAGLPAVVTSEHRNNPGERVLKAAFQKGVGRGRRKEKR